jgi:hypothetical protein
MEPFHAGGVLPKPPQFKIVGSCTIGFIEYGDGHNKSLQLSP